jgi:polysaccharide export outer membrane protein
VSFPLVGTVKMGGQSVAAAEKAIADGLRKGGFVLQPQVNILPLEIRGNQVSVLGQVNRPGRYPLETFNMRVADMLAVAGGVSETGADSLVLSGTRDGSPFTREITLANLFASADAGNDMVAGGDIIYVARAPVFFIYGQVQKPGAYRLDEGMTLMQALATGGGLTNRGTERGMQVHRRNGSGEVEITTLGRNDPLRPDDVIHVKESLF